MADFGYREGFAQLGGYRLSQGGLGFIYAKRGKKESPELGTVEAWVAANEPWISVVMLTTYEPSYVRRFPVRAGVRAGEACALPSVETESLVAAGIANPT